MMRGTFNEMFIASRYPEAWRDVIVKFIPKPNRKGYRPISLTTALGKLMEKMVHFRLEHLIRSRRLIPRH